MGRTSSKKRKSWWKTCNFPKLCVSILQILSEEDHLIIIHFVVEVLVSTHLFFNLIALINLLSMDIDSFCIASSKSKHLYALEWSLYLSSQLPVTKNFPKCTHSFLACIFICV